MIGALLVSVFLAAIPAWSETAPNPYPDDFAGARICGEFAVRGSELYIHVGYEGYVGTDVRLVPRIIHVPAEWPPEIEEMKDIDRVKEKVRQDAEKFFVLGCAYGPFVPTASSATPSEVIMDIEKISEHETPRKPQSSGR